MSNKARSVGCRDDFCIYGRVPFPRRRSVKVTKEDRSTCEQTGKEKQRSCCLDVQSCHSLPQRVAKPRGCQGFVPIPFCTHFATPWERKPENQNNAFGNCDDEVVRQPRAGVLFNVYDLNTTRSPSKQTRKIHCEVRFVEFLDSQPCVLSLGRNIQWNGREFKSLWSF